MPLETKGLFGLVLNQVIFKVSFGSLNEIHAIQWREYGKKCSIEDITDSSYLLKLSMYLYFPFGTDSDMISQS